MFRAARTQAAAVRLLLDAGADAKATDSVGYSPLLYAISAVLHETGKSGPSVTPQTPQGRGYPKEWKLRRTRRQQRIQCLGIQCPEDESRK